MGDSSLSGSEGKTSMGGTYLNASCRPDPIDDIFQESYTQASEYTYGNGALASGNIDLSTQTNQLLDMYATNGASQSSHSLCEWILKTDSSLEVTVEIDISESVYTNVVMKVTSDGSDYRYTSRDTTTCDTGTYTLTLDNTTEVKIRAKILSSSSTYKIQIVQTTDSEASSNTTAEDNK